MTFATTGHSKQQMVAIQAQAAAEPEDPAPAREGALTFERLYEEYFDFVWRSLRRLGFSGAALDDAVQDVFLVVHRRLTGFEERSSAATWLFGIVRRVASEHRRTVRRKDRPTRGPTPDELEAFPDSTTSGPLQRAEHAESIRLLEELLSEMDERKREVFLLAELEQMTGPEIAVALEIELSTAYSRLHAARVEFEAALRRRRERERGGTP
jgi:RNA polymerase sigma-70 factor, ECF subfamily